MHIASGIVVTLIFIATGPIIIEEEEEESGSDAMTDAQMAQLAMFQMREPSLQV